MRQVWWMPFQLSSMDVLPPLFYSSMVLATRKEHGSHTLPMCNFHHKKDGDQKHSKHQAHTMYSIIIGCSPTLNAFSVYNPQNKQYYKPNRYNIDSYTIFQASFKVTWKMVVCSIICCATKMHPWRRNPPPKHGLNEWILLQRFLFPFQWRSLVMLFTTHIIHTQFCLTIWPLPQSLSPKNVEFDPKSPGWHWWLQLARLSPPSFPHLNSKITYVHEGQYHKGFRGKHDEPVMFKLHINKHKDDWGVDLPNLPFTWVDMCVEGILFPGHVSHILFLLSNFSTALHV